MLEIKLNQESDFLKVKETLTRIGIANNDKKVLYQSCHILQKQGKYFIVHFKEMLKLDGRQVNFDQEDQNRRNDIAKLLEEWRLCTIVDPDSFSFPKLNHFRIIGHAGKNEWTLVPKYKIGN